MVVVIGPTYFETLELSMRAGRAFSAEDGRPGAEVAIVNQRWVERFSPRQNPIGRRIRLVGEDRPARWLTVVGVSPTIRQNSPQRGLGPEPVVYLPFRQEPLRSVYLMARGPADPTSLANVLRQEVRAVDTDQPVFRVMTLADALAQERWPYRVFGGLLGVFALIALVLSTIGIYAVTAYSAAQRMQEIGVRMALGAARRQITWLVLRRAAWQTVAGLLVGFAAGFGLSRLIRSILVQSTADDPLTYVAVVTIFIVVTLVASIVPSRRAASLDPNVVLRAE